MSQPTFLLPTHRRIRPALLLMAAAVLLSPGASAQTNTPAQPQPADAMDAALREHEDFLPPFREPWKGDLDAMAKRRVIRVLVPFRRPEFFYLEGRPAGIFQEVFQEIEKNINLKFKTGASDRIVVALLPAPIAKMRERLEKGMADIAVGSISITEQNKAVADFTIPIKSDIKMIVVTGPGAPELTTLDDLSGKTVWVMPGTRMQSDVAALNKRLEAAGKAPVNIQAADPILEPGDVLELVNTGAYPIALMQDMQANFWAQVFPAIKPRKDLALADHVEVGWAIQKNTPQFKAFLDDFIRTHGLGTAFGNTVMLRYMKNANYVRNATEENEMVRFRATQPHFKKYAAKYDLDTLLLAAQGYQESRLDQKVKSPVGAIGIMQVMPKTAASAPVKIPNIQKEENNIHAGARLMHFLIEDYFNEPELDQIQRMLFAIAAYNAGPAKIKKCRAMAKDLGYDPNKWFNNVEVAAAKLIGRETTQYVANIYKYYVTYRLAREVQESRSTATKKATASSN